MNIVEVKSKKEQKKYIKFRQSIYSNYPQYVDNNLFMIKELFSKKTCFIDNKEMHVFYVEDNKRILCQGIVIYTESLPDYIQLGFFESLPKQERAVKLLLDNTVAIGKNFHCKKIVVGLYGHVNYGLGFLYSHYKEKNSFSASANPKYYHSYFEDYNCSKIFLNTYKSKIDDIKFERYQNLLSSINKRYTFHYFDKTKFDEYSKIYTDLNNLAFGNHRYYYSRNYNEDKEMLKELFMFMQEDSLIFAFENDKPVGFIMWYPDFNKLVKSKDAFGPKHFFKNLALGGNIKTGKIMEYGILEDYRKSGLIIGLLYEIGKAMRKHKIEDLESSWILDENADSNSICKGLCKEKYKRYVVYEKRI